MASNLIPLFSLIIFFCVSQVCCVVNEDPPIPKVSLSLYYESLCPYSASFIVNSLNPIFSNDLIDIIDLKLFPWGNAKLRSDTTIQCQHGPLECFFNTIEACAIDAWPNPGDHFPFIKCVEELAYEGKYTKWETCFGQLGLDSKPVTDCYSNGHGKELDFKYAAITDSLQPPHTYVPWVVVDGQPLYEDYGNFTRYVCNAYKGTSSPVACVELSFGNLEKTKKDHVSGVCYTEETAKMSLLRSTVGSSIDA